MTGGVTSHMSFILRRSISTGVGAARAGSVSLNYSHTATKSASPKTPLVIIHGLLGSATNWRSLSKALASRGERDVYAVDARNHGGSPHVEAMGSPELASDLLAFVDELPTDSAILVGHSMGGKAVMQAALEDGDSLAGVVVVDMAPREYNLSVHSEVGRYVSTMAEMDIGSFARRSDVDAALAEVATDPTIRAFLMTNAVGKGNDRGDPLRWKANLPVLARSMGNLGAPIVSSHVFSGPLLSIYGRNSGYVDQAGKDATRALFPNAEFASVDAGHWLHAEQPTVFVDSLLSFFDSHNI